MELIEGVTLADLFSALKEKQQKLTEQRVWNIFVQVSVHLHPPFGFHTLAAHCSGEGDGWDPL